MRRYHHIGIPTTQAKPGETHLKHLKLFVVSHEKSEFGVEWMRFEADAAVPDLVRQVPHVAFEVADLASELAGRECGIEGIVAKFVEQVQLVKAQQIAAEPYGQVITPLIPSQRVRECPGS